MSGLRGNSCGILDDLIFGDGSDGDVVVSGSLFVDRDMFFRNLTIAKGVRFNTSGHKIRVREILTVDGDFGDSGIIANSGMNARASTGQASEISGTNIPPGTPGAPVGTTGGGGRGGAGMYHGGRGIGNTLHPSQTGSAFVPAVDFPFAVPFSLGGRGGRGGDAVSGTYGASNFYVFAGDLGASGSAPILSGGLGSFFTLQTGGTVTFGGTTTYSGSFSPSSFKVFAGGTGGGAGACMNSGSIGVRPRSGWGGGGGGVVFICAREIVLNGRIEARGGHGGNTFSRAGGGGGGGGGTIFLGYSKLTTLNQIDQHLIVAGGLPGIGQSLPIGSSTTGSLAGSSGSYFLYEV